MFCHVLQRSTNDTIFLLANRLGKDETPNHPMSLYPTFQPSKSFTESDVTEAQWDISTLEELNLWPTQKQEDAYGKPFMDSYFELLALGDDELPGSNTRLSPDNVDGCIASTGYEYYGLSVYHTIFEELDEDDTPWMQNPWMVGL